MATVNSQIAAKMLKNNGIYPGDPQCLAIFRYENDFDGGFAYSICYHIEEINALLHSPYCHNTVCLWERGKGLTFIGELELSQIGGQADGPR